ncbi:hypothetical protein HPB48_013061 [Haemaphysalis longicornis]|uniref:Tick transposon n=1 Tax=Haemaphysalis longicornis TaxID=44386 RepID=A0A9J6GB42_HAELO|nr:hypothetical protein HPB48_013061 [Haemaphysalis longicornis]
MKKTLNLPFLTTRRLISRLCLFHKIFYDNETLKQSLFIPPAYISTRLDHHLKIGVPCSNTNLYFGSFLQKTSVDWNSLPAGIVSTKELEKFKSALANHFY